MIDYYCFSNKVEKQDVLNVADGSENSIKITVLENELIKSTKDLLDSEQIF